METLIFHASGTVASRSPLRLSLVGDERLARLVGEGNERAFAALYERYHQPLYRYCRSIVRDEADAQDVLQSALASAFAALGRGQRDAPLRPWLFRIAHNEAVSLLRRRHAVAELSDECGGAAPSVEERAAGRARLRQLTEDLHELPERQRSALVMRELSGLSHEEIALALGTSPGAAKQAIFEARHALGECEQGRAMTCEEVLRTVSDGDRRLLRGRRVRAHLRDCAGCAAFAAAIPARRSDLAALAPPLAPAAAAGLLARMLGAGSGHSSGGAMLAAGAGKSLSAAVAIKTAVGVAIIATATLGLTRELAPTTQRPAPTTRTHAAEPPHRAVFPTTSLAQRHAAAHASRHRTGHTTGRAPAHASERSRGRLTRQRVVRGGRHGRGHASLARPTLGTGSQPATARRHASATQAVGAAPPAAAPRTDTHGSAQATPARQPASSHRHQTPSRRNSAASASTPRAARPTPASHPAAHTQHHGSTKPTPLQPATTPTHHRAAGASGGTAAHPKRTAASHGSTGNTGAASRTAISNVPAQSSMGANGVSPPDTAAGPGNTPPQGGSAAAATSAPALPSSPSTAGSQTPP